MKKLHTLIGTALIFGASSASADGAVELNNTELDGVTAGGILFADGFALAGGDVTGPGATVGIETILESAVSVEEGEGSLTAEGFSFASSASSGTTDTTIAVSLAEGEGAFEATSETGDISGSTVSSSGTDIDITLDSASATASSINTTIASTTGGEGTVGAESASAATVAIETFFAP